jgi:predicted nucleotidyltransferase
MEQLKTLKESFSQEQKLAHKTVTVFSAGSLGRLEAGGNSDLDIFVVAKPHQIGRLSEIRLLSKVADLNDKVGFPPFSDEMRYLKIYDGKELIDNTGQPKDDSENSFTTRMLLLLESACLANESLYHSVIREVCANYFRDNKGKKDFRPLFLINDLLRYWRTLCLNYEGCRDDANKPWRKKNMNLRFSRLTTVFATVAILIIDRPSRAEDFLEYTKQTPLLRLANAVDKLNDNSVSERFVAFLDHYATFLRIKDSPNPERLLEKGDIKQNIRLSANEVSDFFAEIFGNPSLKSYSRYLIL